MSKQQVNKKSTSPHLYEHQPTSSLSSLMSSTPSHAVISSISEGAKDDHPVFSLDLPNKGENDKHHDEANAMLNKPLVKGEIATGYINSW